MMSWDDIETAIDEDYDGELDEDDFIEVVCPHCGETVYFDEDMIDSDDGLICPNCNETIEFEIPGGEEERGLIFVFFESHKQTLPV